MPVTSRLRASNWALYTISPDTRSLELDGAMHEAEGGLSELN